jgi:hypothetical protein
VSTNSARVALLSILHLLYIFHFRIPNLFGSGFALLN